MPPVCRRMLVVRRAPATDGRIRVTLGVPDTGNGSDES